MTERLLQFIWQFQYFNKKELETRDGESLQIIFPGTHNTNQGPDFSEAKIRIGRTLFAGNIELHLNTSDWKKHKHDGDKNYSNVILHVVWEDDTNANSIPVLELKGKVAALLLSRYEELMYAVSFIPCQHSVSGIKPLVWQAWKERLIAERLLRKFKQIESSLLENNFHWEETFWWLLARNFGMKVNAEAFEAVARSIPLNILAKHKNQVHQLEAILLGQAGILGEKYKDDYAIMLQKEYKFLRGKYKLDEVKNKSQFLRMRPGNFPTIRLAQLAMLIHQSAHLFSKIRESGSVKQVIDMFAATANDYWLYHYRFDQPSSYKKKAVGSDMTSNILINTIIPMLFAYGHHHKEKKYKEKALAWLEQSGLENNAITRGFRSLGIENKNAHDSQALIELKNEYCNKKRCLDCAVGNAILRS